MGPPGNVFIFIRHPVGDLPAIGRGDLIGGARFAFVSVVFFSLLKAAVEN